MLTTIGVPVFWNMSVSVIGMNTTFFRVSCGVTYHNVLNVSKHPLQLGTESIGSFIFKTSFIISL